MNPRCTARLLAVALAACAAALPGCQLFGFIASGAEEYKRSKPRDVEAEYRGLEGHTFAVIVSADRMIQADHPGVTDELTLRITERLEAESGAAGRVPAVKTLRYLYDHPSWVARPRGELARELGVDRLVCVELLEYQVHDPGNRYVWSGVAAGTVGVVEAEGPLPDEFAFQKSIRVNFPDEAGHGAADMSQVAVTSVLVARFTDRASWLFYTHKETLDMKY